MLFAVFRVKVLSYFPEETIAPSSSEVAKQENLTEKMNFSSLGQEKTY